MKHLFKTFTFLFLAIIIMGCNKTTEEHDEDIERICGSITDEENENTDNKSNTPDIPAYVWPEGSRYYYAYEEKMFLDTVHNKIVLSFNEKFLSAMQQYLQKNEQISHMELFYFNSGYILTIAENANVKALIEDLKKQQGVKSVNPMYALDGFEMGVTDEIVVQFKEHVSQQEIDGIHKRYQVEVKKTTDIYSQILSVPIYMDVLEVANAYQESGLVIYSHPAFVAKAVHGF